MQHRCTRLREKESPISNLMTQNVKKTRKMNNFNVEFIHNFGDGFNHTSNLTSVDKVLALVAATLVYA